jgi:hypothetical protein
MLTGFRWLVNQTSIGSALVFHPLIDGQKRNNRAECYPLVLQHGLYSTINYTSTNQLTPLGAGPAALKLTLAEDLPNYELMVARVRNDDGESYLVLSFKDHRHASCSSNRMPIPLR